MQCPKLRSDSVAFEFAISLIKNVICFKLLEFWSFGLRSCGP